MERQRTSDSSSKDIEALVQNGFINLQAWLEKRFQQQDDMFRWLGQERGLGSCIEVGQAQSLTKNETDRASGDSKPTEEDPLRMAARIMGQKDLRLSSIEHPLDSTGEEPASLSGRRPPSAGRRPQSGKRHSGIQKIMPGAQYGKSPAEVEAMSLPGFASDDKGTNDVAAHKCSPTAPSPAPAAQGWIAEAKATEETVPSSTPKDDESAKEMIPMVKSASRPLVEPEVPEQDWQSRMMDIFDQLDLDRSGSIDRHEFEMVFEEVGMPPVQAFQVFASAEQDGNKVMDRAEWLHMIESAENSSSEEMDLLVQFIAKLDARQKKAGHIYSTDRKVKPPFMIIHHEGAFRMTWDILIMILLFYISLALPYALGFGQPDELSTMDRVFDLVFCVDVVLNFRTSFVDSDEYTILDGREIGCRYLKTWFLLDFMSSVPFDWLTAGLLPSFQPAKLLKMGKVAKVMKLLKVNNMLKGCEGSELFVQMEEKSASKASQTMVRLVQLMCLNLVLAHWLACFGASVDNNHLDVYFEGNGITPTGVQKYLAAVYWAMTTLSTVGYGDILPTTDFERIYAMFAMVVGGAFYGYIIGSVTSIVADMDLNARAFSNRMDLVQSWLDCHVEIPKSLRRRVRKSYRITLSKQSALEDHLVLAELSPELRSEMARFIINGHVRANPMFSGVSAGALANLVMVLQHNHAHSNEFIVKIANPGVAMYTLVDGTARYDKGSIWRPPRVSIDDPKFHKLKEGESFGEEIVFGLEETYTYTIVAITSCQFHSISEDGFIDQYKNMPEVHKMMYDNFVRQRSTPPPPSSPGSKALVLMDQGGSTTEAQSSNVIS